MDLPLRDHNPNSPTSRPASPIRCPICMEDLSPTAAKLMPCGHEFDLDCAARLIKGLELSGKVCPLCRTRIIQVQWNFKPNGNYDYFILGSGVDDTGPFIREDEEIQQYMHEPERARRRDLRRLRAKEDAGFHRCLKWFIQVKEGDLMVAVTRSVTLDIDQVGIFTKVKLLHTLELHSRDVIQNDFFDRFYINKPEDLIALAKAREQIKQIQERIGDIRLVYTNFELKTPAFHILRDAKNLRADAQAIFNISRPEMHSNKHEHVIIGGTQYLWEAFPELPLDEIVSEPETYTLHGLHGPACRRGINMARQQISTAIQRFDRAMMSSVADRFVGASTAIFDDVSAEERECEYCGGKQHQNGECLIPEIKQDGSDNIELTWFSTGEGDGA